MTKTWHFAQSAVNGITKSVKKFQPLSLTTNIVNIFVLGAANDLLLKLSTYALCTFILDEFELVLLFIVYSNSIIKHPDMIYAILSHAAIRTTVELEAMARP